MTPSKARLSLKPEPATAEVWASECTSSDRVCAFGGQGTPQQGLTAALLKACSPGSDLRTVYPGWQ